MDPKKLADALLRDDGFDDIEYADGSIRSDSPRGKDGNRLAIEPQAARYSTMAGQFLDEYPFDSDEHRDVWRLHAEGNSYAEIADLLWSNKDKRRVFLILTPIRHAMLARFRRGRRPGRPANPDGRGRSATVLSTRLSTREAEALWFVAEACDLTIAEASRRAFLLVATMMLQGKLGPSALNSVVVNGERRGK